MHRGGALVRGCETRTTNVLGTLMGASTIVMRARYRQAKQSNTRQRVGYAMLHGTRPSNLTKGPNRPLVALVQALVAMGMGRYCCHRPLIPAKSRIALLVITYEAHCRGEKHAWAGDMMMTSGNKVACPTAGLLISIDFRLEIAQIGISPSSLPTCWMQKGQAGRQKYNRRGCGALGQT